MRDKNVREVIQRAQTKREPLVFYDQNEIQQFMLKDLPYLGNDVPEGWQRGKRVNAIVDRESLESFRTAVSEIERTAPSNFIIGFGISKASAFGVEIYAFVKLPTLPVV